jgi:hypothetical protein
MKRENIKNAIQLWRAFSAGILLGFGLLGTILKHRGHLADDAKLGFWLMVGIPLFVILGNLPAMFLQVADGIRILKRQKTRDAEPGNSV